MRLHKIQLCTSHVYTSVSLHVVHVTERLFVHIELLLSVCVCTYLGVGGYVRVCKGSGLSQHPRRGGHSLTGVYSSLQNSSKQTAAQCAHSGLERDNRDITGPL